MSEREEILANFQSITATEDVSEAIYLLEECNWDLHRAIQNFMPLEQASVSEPQLNHPIDVDLYNENDQASGKDDVIMTAPSSPFQNFNPRIYQSNSNIQDGPSTSRSGNNGELETIFKNLDFIIHHNNNMYKITIPSNSTVSDLKQEIHNKTGIPSCRQLLHKWNQTFQNKKDRNWQESNSTPLNHFILSKETDLELKDLSEDGFVDDDFDVAIVSSRPKEYKLNIKILDENKTVSISFDGDKTLFDIKQAVADVTRIEVRNQLWNGWPPRMNSNTTLEKSGIDSEHNLIVSRTHFESNSLNNSIERETIEIDSDEEFVDANDDDFTIEPQKHNQKYLIPDQIESERLGSEKFFYNYIERYTDKPHPDFFVGSLEEAYHTACLKSAKERKLLAIYLHHDNSVLTNVFCSQLLGCEVILETLSHNFILYGWDLTFESNKNLLLSSISACLGPSIAMNVRNIPVVKLPTILIINRIRGSCDILAAIDGNVGVNELSAQLLEAVELFSDQRETEIREENERAERERILVEQDRAFEESLEADRLKEMKKQQQELKIESERKRLEFEKAETEARQEAKRNAARNSLPPEPTETTGITKIRITKPEGDFIERKFTVDTHLKTLLNFIVSEGFFIEEYKLIAFPRTDLTSEDPEKTLKSLQLFPQVTVRLEQR